MFPAPGWFVLLFLLALPFPIFLLHMMFVTISPRVTQLSALILAAAATIAIFDEIWISKAPDMSLDGFLVAAICSAIVWFYAVLTVFVAHLVESRGWNVFNSDSRISKPKRATVKRKSIRRRLSEFLCLPKLRSRASVPALDGINNFGRPLVYFGALALLLSLIAVGIGELVLYLA